MQKTIIVTLRDRDFEKDLELPWLVPMEELYPRLHEALRRIKPSKFNMYHGILLIKDGKVLPSGKDTLADYGVCTGCYMELMDEGGIYGR